MRQIPLNELKHIIGYESSADYGNFVTPELAVARNVEVSSIMNFLGDTPVVLPEMRIIIVKRGWVTPVVNLIHQRVESEDLMFLGRDGIVQFMDVSDDVKGIGLSLSDDLFSHAVGNHIPHAFDGHIREFKLKLEHDEMEFLDNLHRLIYESVSHEQGIGAATHHLLGAFLWHIHRLWERNVGETRRELSHEQRVFADFLQLVGRFAPAQHQIGFYASELCISPRYMSAIVKQMSGKAAKQWIDEAIVTRIKIELRHTGKPMSQISDEMNFPNVAFFCKYFKRLTGSTPKSYRNGAE